MLRSPTSPDCDTFADLLEKDVWSAKNQPSLFLAGDGFDHSVIIDCTNLARQDDGMAHWDSAMDEYWVQIMWQGEKPMSLFLAEYRLERETPIVTDYSVLPSWRGQPHLKEVRIYAVIARACSLLDADLTERNHRRLRCLVRRPDNERNLVSFQTVSTGRLRRAIRRRSSPTGMDWAEELRMWPEIGIRTSTIHDADVQSDSERFQPSCILLEGTCYHPWRSDWPSPTGMEVKSLCGLCCVRSA